MEAVKNFYSKIQFPGHYKLSDLEFYDEFICNRYLEIFDKELKGINTVLDVGCGTGFITNFLARRHPDIKFEAIDFSNSIDYAKQFSKQNKITNVSYFKKDFLKFDTDKTYDLIFCNGVIHHIPDYKTAVEKIKNLTNKKIILGVYNTYGKILKRLIPVNYSSNILYQDQELCPFELTFTDKEIKILFDEYKLTQIFPSVKNQFVDIANFFNHQNGGLTIYTFNK